MQRWSEDYLMQLSRLHAVTQWGTTGHRWAFHVMKLINEHGFKSVLDYGCGRGTLMSAIQPRCEGVKISGYDPAIKEVSKPPKPADLIVCTDVLEHIEPQFINNVLEHIHSLTDHMAFFVIATTPAYQRLPDGRNAHLIVEGRKYWLPKLSKFFKSIKETATESKKNIVLEVFP